MMSFGSRMHAVQDPIIPIIGKWIQDVPGTISLGQGIVSYPPPPDVFEALTSLDPMIHRYHEVQGVSSLRRLILEKLKQENNLSIGGIEQIVVTAGSNMGFMNAILAITQPGDEVIIQTPYYFNHEMAIRMAGAKPILVSTTESCQLDINAISASITNKTRAIVTISPNNPTGAVYPHSDLKAVNQICRDQGLFHISDEAYEYFVYDDVHHCSPAQFDPHCEHTISLFSLSKAYGFAGWRIGYMVIPEKLQLSIQKIQDTILICPPLISQVAAETALTIGYSYPKTYLNKLAMTRGLIFEKLNSIRHKCRFIRPYGAFYFWLEVLTDQSAMELVRSLINEHQIAVIPGTAFDNNSGCFLRIAYGALDSNTTMEGLDRLIEGIKALVPD